jgi:predicted metal-dependent phosphoesterase TrpH
LKFKIDLHVHSKYSEDTDAEPEEILLRAIELGLHGVAFTEHYYYGSSEPVERLRETYRDRLLIFRGVEFLTAEGHCLVFGVDTDKLLMNNAPIDDLIGIVNKAGGVVIPSHPFRPGTGIGDLVLTARGIAALEGCNGVNARDVDNKAIEAARALNIPYTGGSDAHDPMEVGCCFTEFNEKVTYENFIDLLREGKCRGADTRKTTKMVTSNF